MGEGFYRAHLELLERIALGAALDPVLDGIVRLIEDGDPDVTCSVVLLDPDGIRIRPRSVSRLPPAFVAMLDGLEIGPTAGSCGAAAYLAERVIVEDIATHPNWERYRDLALPFGLRACWSSPILAPDGTVLGTFAVYYPEPRGPTAEELARVDIATHVAAIAIEARRMAETIRTGEALRALLYASVAHPIFCVAVEGKQRYRVISANAACLALSSRPGAEVIGRFVHELLPAAMLPTALAMAAQAISTRHEVRWEQVIEAGDADVRHVEIKLSAVFDGDVCRSVIGTIHDVTDRRQVDVRRRELEAELHRQRRTESLTMLAGGIAHDFNNIIAAISAHADLAARATAEPETRESLEEIQRATQRATALVRQLLTLGTAPDQRATRVDLRAVIEEGARLMRASFPRQIVLATELGTEPLEGHVDAGQIHQVMLNLLTNAMHAIGARPGKVTVAAHVDDYGTEAPMSLRRGRYARITVTDTGHGIEPAALARVFDPFFTTKGSGGTGLGLAIVDKILRGYGGSITVRSAVGVGTSFELFIPLLPAPPEAVPLPPPRVAAEPVPNGARLLFVDDEEAMTFLGTRVLSRLGYQVSSHTSAREALAVFRAAPDDFDAVISDISMPEMSGVSLVEEVRRLRPGMPTILTTGYVRPEDLSLARALGLADPIPKPHTIQEFAWMISRHLERLHAVVAPAS